jgi:CheY-like chemotaxis protein/tetratricopeptide (TPR) repeat protein
MDLATRLTTLKNQSRDLTVAERADLSCRIAKQLEKAGDYEAARDVMDEFWPEHNEPPKVQGLDQPETAEVLLRIGALAGWLGSAHQAQGSQETAKNLITESIEIFDKLGLTQRVAEARGDLALCYWREGAFDEARINLENALSLVQNSSPGLKATLLIRAGIVEVWSQRLNEASRLYNEAAPLLDETDDHALKGSYHDELAVLFMKLSEGLNSKDYVDRALIEYTAASFHFERAEHRHFQARVENNLGYLFFTLNRFNDAHVHLDRARMLFLELGDRGAAAGVDETRARTLIAEGRLREGERCARAAVRTLEKSDEQALLAEALTTHGIATARLGNYSRAKALLDRAVEVAQIAGDSEGAGRANLSIIEELSGQVPAKEMASVFKSAADLLQRSQDPSAGKRLFSCASTVIDALAGSDNDDQDSAQHSWEGFSFKQQVLNCEKALIERALRDAGGSVTRAARLLGFRHHQSLISLINSRHKELLKTRSKVRPRRSHIFSERRKIKKKAVRSPQQQATSNISILHVADDEAIRKLIQDILAVEGTEVDSCVNGTTALEILKGDSPYDLIIVDNDLPGLSGLELVLRARSMALRRNTPIIMLSADDCEKEAWRAGANAFLRKPEAVDRLSSTITRLLEEQRERAN